MRRTHLEQGLDDNPHMDGDATVPRAELTAIQIDQERGFVYTTAELTDGSFALFRLNVDLTAVVDSCPLPNSNDTPWALSLDDTYVYTGHASRFVTRLHKDTCAPTTLALPDPAGTTDVRSLQIDTSGQFLFANTFESRLQYAEPSSG